MARELKEALAIPKPALSHLYPSTHRRRCPLHEHPLVQVGRGGNGGFRSWMDLLILRRPWIYRRKLLLLLVLAFGGSDLEPIPLRLHRSTIARESKRGATAQQPRNDMSNVGNCWCSSIFMVIVGPTFRYAGLSCCSFEVWGANLVWTNCQMYHYKFLRVV
uniref:Uncharacterized protein n=1 Tax=Oryza barthii TaxID=65489 RepID=A0A0D3FFR7_9ORYZ